jgi:hypothetical protein
VGKGGENKMRFSTYYRIRAPMSMFFGKPIQCD